MKQPELGKKIAELRKLKGLTQEQLVDLCNISVRTIQRIETGEVTPRSYTIKTILSALDSKMEDIREEEKGPADLRKTLQLSWIFGGIYVILGIIEGPMDMMRISGNYGAGTFNMFPLTDFNESFYLIVKVVVVASYFLFLRGFTALGTRLNNSLLKIISMILIGFVIFSISYDVISLYYTPVDFIIVLTGLSVVFGVLGIIFGIALIQLRSIFGNISLIAGLLEILAGCFFIMIDPVGFPVQMVAGILQVMILYQAIAKPHPAPAT